MANILTKLWEFGTANQAVSKESIQRIYPEFADHTKEIQKISNTEQNILQNLAEAYDLTFDSVDGNRALDQLSVINQIIDVLSNTLARVPFTIVTDVDGNGDFEDYKNHFWYIPVKYKPNSAFSDFEFRRMIATSVALDGNAYVYKNRARQELEFIHPDMIDQIILVNGEKMYHSSKLNYVFLSDEILHYKTYSNNASLKGMSKLKVAQLNANLLNLATRTSEEYYRHGARSPLIIERDFDKSVNQASLDEAIDAMEKKYLTGMGSIRKLFVLPTLAKAKELKVTAEDQAFVSIAQYTNEQLANLWGLPSYLVYSSKGTSGKYEQESLAFKDNTLANYLEMFRTTTRDGLISIEDRMELNADVIYDMSKIQTLDYTTLSTQAVQLSNNGVITKNEARQMIGKKRFDSENADKLLTQSQWISLDDRDITDASPTPKQETTKEKTTDDNK